ncbi:MAG: aminotransferase class IV [Brevinematales bacterium]|nr:aminotransferase class IV [Brevinematales bacterium]
MFQFFESIRLEKDGFQLLEYHQRRVTETCAKYYPGKKPWELHRILVPVPRVEGRTKCRLVYDGEAYQIFYEPYRMREIERVIIVEKEINYPYKFLERKELEEYTQKVGPKDMVVFSREGMITDSVFSNVVFFDGKEWVTPSTYLLNGVKRQYYLDQGMIREEKIHVRDLVRFSYVGFMNAMVDIGELVVPMTNVEVCYGLENL